MFYERFILHFVVNRSAHWLENGFLQLKSFANHNAGKFEILNLQIPDYYYYYQHYDLNKK